MGTASAIRNYKFNGRALQITSRPDVTTAQPPHRTTRLGHAKAPPEVVTHNPPLGDDSREDPPPPGTLPLGAFLDERRHTAQRGLSTHTPPPHAQ